MSHDPIPVRQAMAPPPQFSLTTYRHECHGMRPDPDGQWVSLQDGRRTFNVMQSQLVSAGLGPMSPRELREAHQHRGDNRRIWQIIGGGMDRNEDIFQRTEKLVRAGLLQAAQIRELNLLVQQLREQLATRAPLAPQALPTSPPALPEPRS